MGNSNKGIWMKFLGLIVLVIIGFLIFHDKRNKVVNNENQNSDSLDEVTNTDNSLSELCYIWNTEAGDKATLKIDVSGENAMGTINWLPAEKDKKTGGFIGTVGPVDTTTMTATIDGWWNSSAEGVNNREQVRIKFGESVASIGFGEMVDSGDGTYVYANPDDLSYEPNLSKTDCNDSAMAL